MSLPQTIILALSSRQFYDEVPKKTFKSALGYFLLLTFLLAIIRSLTVTVSIIPSVKFVLSKLQENIIDLYPADLSIKIENGQVSSDAPQPYIIPATALTYLLPQATSDLHTPVTAQDNIFVLDTKATSDDFTKYKTFLLLTRTGLVVQEGNTQGYRVYPFSKETNQTIDRRTVRAVWSQVSPFFGWILPALVVTLWICLILWYPLANLVFLFFASIFLYLGLKIVKYPYSFGTIYKIGLYAVTWPLAVQFLFDLAGSTTPPLATTAVFLIFTLFMLKPSSDTKS